MRLSVGTLVFLITSVGAHVANAHIQMFSPQPRTTELKTGPCGSPNDARGSNINYFRPGETITVVWQETVPHPSHYRISFDADGTDDFVDPLGFDDYYTGPSVLLDNIPDRDGTLMYRQQITLPMVECENCTLQLIQVMTDKAPYVSGTDDIYYQCADLVLSATAAQPDAGTSDGNEPRASGGSSSDLAAAGCTVASSRSSGGGALGIAIILLGFLWRRSRAPERNRVLSRPPTIS